MPSDFTVDTFVAASIQWADKRNSQFKYNWPVKGGWEGWIQVDLCAYILSVDSTYDILREQAIFTNALKRADLLLNTELATSKQIPVEMKAESFENRGTNFVNGVRDDVTKITNERATPYAQASCVNVAFPFSPESLQAVESIQQNGHRIFATVFKKEIAMCVAVWKYPGGWVTMIEEGGEPAYDISAFAGSGDDGMEPDRRTSPPVTEPAPTG